MSLSTGMMFFLMRQKWASTHLHSILCGSVYKATNYVYTVQGTFIYGIYLLLQRIAQYYSGTYPDGQC